VVNDTHVAAFLRTRFGSDVSEVSTIGQGQWSQAYAFRRAGAGYVARFSALREDFEKDRLAARFASPVLPVPLIVEVGEAFGGFYAVSERAYGDSLDTLDRAQMRSVLPSLLAALDAARVVDVSPSVGYGIWGADGTAPHATWPAALLDAANDRPASRTHGWRAQLERSPTGPGPFEEGYQRLQLLVAYCPEERHLIHGDLLANNVVVEGDRITAVLDWGCSMYGDFLYDVAWFLFWSPWYPAWKGIDFRGEAVRHYESIGLQVPHVEERLRCYQVHIGLGGQAYNAFRGRWTELDATVRRTLEVAPPGQRSTP
jgi:hygromycin-B 4-O-kinase